MPGTETITTNKKKCQLGYSGNDKYLLEFQASITSSKFQATQANKGMTI